VEAPGVGSRQSNREGAVTLLVEGVCLEKGVEAQELIQKKNKNKKTRI